MSDTTTTAATTTRRGFMGIFSAALAAAGVDAATTDRIASLDVPGGDVARLVKLIDLHGPQAVAEQLLLQPGPVDVTALNRHFNRVVRHRSAAKRRERHAGTEVLYRGPVRLWQSFATTEYRGVHRKVRAGYTEHDLTLTGIGVPAAGRDEAAPSVRQVDIPRGSRILFDSRHGLAHDVWAAEVTRQHDGFMRLHLWQGATARQWDEDEFDALPLLTGGAYETPGGRTVGLLGLPL